MKKITIAFMLIASASYSQFNFGAKLGVNSSITKGKAEYKVADFESVYHITGGAFAEYQINKFAVSIEAEYIEQGYKNWVTIGQFSTNSPFASPSEFTTKGINIYLVPKYYILKRLSVNVGGYFGTIHESKITTDASSLGKSNEFVIDISDDYSKIDYGIVLGASFYIYKGLFVDARYNLGLKDITDGGNSKNYLEFLAEDAATGRPRKQYELYNRTIILSVGYRFIKNKKN